jgi:hypothetical protein
MSTPVAEEEEQCTLALEGAEAREAQSADDGVLQITTTSGTTLRLRPVAMAVTPSKAMELWNRFQGPHLADGHLDKRTQAAVVAFMRAQKTEALTDGDRNVTFAGGSLAICYPDRLKEGEAAKPAVPTFVLETDRLWKAYLKAERDKDASNAELAKAERMARGGTEDWSLVFQGCKSDQFARVKVASKAIELVRSHAERAFAPEGGRLEIDDRWLLDQLAITYENYDQLDLIKAWTLLEGRYGGTKGQDEGHRQNARKLLDKFNLKEEKPSTVGGMVVLNLRVWTQQEIGGSRGSRELSYNCREDVHKATTAFAAFLRTIGEQHGAQELDNFTRRFAYASCSVVSRQVFKFGFGQITTYYERFEFRVLPHIAEQLQVYLGTHAPNSADD